MKLSINGISAEVKEVYADDARSGGQLVLIDAAQNEHRFKISDLNEAFRCDFLSTLWRPLGRDRMSREGGGKMNTKEIRELLGVSRAEFSRRYHIPIRTLEDWDAGIRKPADWVLELLERVVKMDINMDGQDTEAP